MRKLTILFAVLAVGSIIPIYGYDIYDGTSNINAQRNVLVVPKGTYSIPSVGANMATLIILPGANISDVSSLEIGESSSVYLWGMLDFSNAQVRTNNGTIHKIQGSTIQGDFSSGSNGSINVISDESQILTKQKINGQRPTKTADGWKDYWCKGISVESQSIYSEYVPIYYYMDEGCTIPIDDLEAWKMGAGHWEYPKAEMNVAITAIDTEVGGSTDADILEVANAAKEEIENTLNVTKIVEIKDLAIYKIMTIKDINTQIGDRTRKLFDNVVIKDSLALLKHAKSMADAQVIRIEIMDRLVPSIWVYDSAKAEDQKALPTDPEGTKGTAVVVTKGEKSITLINPDKVSYIKVE